MSKNHLEKGAEMFLTYAQRTYYRKAVEEAIKKDIPSILPPGLVLLTDPHMIALELMVSQPGHDTLKYALRAIDLAVEDKENTDAN